MIGEEYKDEYKPYSVGDIEWKYPHEHEPPRGKKLNILTCGGVAIHGFWKDNHGFIAWQDMFKRNRAKEAAAAAWLKAQGR